MLGHQNSRFSSIWRPPRLHNEWGNVKLLVHPFSLSLRFYFSGEFWLKQMAILLFLLSFLSFFIFVQMILMTCGSLTVRKSMDSMEMNSELLENE
jgi:hypothetical protein